MDTWLGHDPIHGALKGTLIVHLKKGTTQPHTTSIIEQRIIRISSPIIQVSIEPMRRRIVSAKRMALSFSKFRFSSLDNQITVTAGSLRDFLFSFECDYLTSANDIETYRIRKKRFYRAVEC